MLVCTGKPLGTRDFQNMYGRVVEGQLPSAGARASAVRLPTS